MSPTNNLPRSNGPASLELEVIDLQPRFEDFEKAYVSSPQEGSDDVVRTGTMLTASAHIVTTVIGAGVLSLPYAIMWLGWIAGPMLLFLFFFITWATSNMLVDAHKIKGKRFGRYSDCVRAVLGQGNATILLCCQMLNLWTLSLAYAIAFGKSIYAVVELIHGPSSFNHQWLWTACFGIAQLFLAQLPSLDSLAVVSIVGAICSFGYALSAIVLSATHITGLMGSIGGNPGTSAADKVFQICNAVGVIAFAFNYMSVIMEIQQTICEPPCQRKSMRTAVGISMNVITAMYVAVSFLGYAAFGDNLSTYILDNFPGPKGAVVLANLFVAVHMLSAFQVMQQPMYEKATDSLMRFLKKRGAARAAVAATATATTTQFVTDTMAPSTTTHAVASLPASGNFPAYPAAPTAPAAAAAATAAALDPEQGMVTTSPAQQQQVQQQAYTPSRWTMLVANQSVRLSFVAVTVFIACAVPFFSDILGIVGGLLFWPQAVYFPVRIAFRLQKSGSARRALWVTITAFTAVISVCAVVGSARNFVLDASTLSVFP